MPRKNNQNRKNFVYLQYPWMFPDSPYYKYLIQNPPSGFEYVNGASQKGAIHKKQLFLFLGKTKRLIRSFLKFSGITITNSRYTKSDKKYDVIHCAHCLSKEKTPWVADFEGVWQFWISRGKSGKRRVLKMIESPFCKKIMPWSEDTRRRILDNFPEIEDKIEVVYPALPLQKKMKKESKGLRIIYASRYFWIKGGLVALETLRRIKKMYPSVEVIFVSTTPKKLKDKYKEINFKELMPQKNLFNYMRESDIFFYPSFIDTFGFSILEAMSFGVPTVAVYHSRETHAVKEIIDDGKTGFIVEHKRKELEYHKLENPEEDLIKELTKKLSILIENKKLREKMSQNCIKQIKNGKFSINKRNRKLKKIYEEALK